MAVIFEKLCLKFFASTVELSFQGEKIKTKVTKIVESLQKSPKNLSNVVQQTIFRFLPASAFFERLEVQNFLLSLTLPRQKNFQSRHSYCQSL
jgi:hypothetical protein